MKNLSQMMKQAQQMQEKMGQMQDELANIEVTGSAGAGLVSVIMTAKGELKKVSLDQSLFADGDKEMLEDLIVAAHRDAKQKAEEKTAEEMSKVTGGLSLPPGFKLPF